MLLDEMDDEDAPDDAIEAAEALQDAIEELRETINGKHYRPGKRRTLMSWQF